MTLCALLCPLSAAWLSLGALMTLHEIPLEQPDAVCFIADANGRGDGDLFVAGTKDVLIYPGATGEETWRVTFDGPVSALDVADTDGDGLPEMLAVSGRKIQKYALGPEPSPPVILFEAENQWDAPASSPFPCVLVVPRNGRPLIALPANGALELRSTHGEIMESFPLGPDAARRVSFGRPFTVQSLRHAAADGAGGLEWRVAKVEAFVPRLPGDLAVAEPFSARQGWGSARMAAAAGKGAESWPWLPLRTDKNSDERVLFAYPPPPARETLIRTRRAQTPGQGSGRELKLSDPQRYPGFLAPPEEILPDFNQDGFADAIFWNAETPAPTVGAVTRAAAGGVWSARLTLHAFLPAQGRYAPEPFTVIPLSLPVGWLAKAFSAEPPLPFLIPADFNGDGRSDLLCPTATDTIGIWVSTPSGMRPAPHETHRFSQPVESVALRADLDRRGRSSVIFRSGGMLHVLRARREES